MEKLDTLVLQGLTHKVASSERLKVMIKVMKAKIKNAHDEQNTHLITRQKELFELEEVTGRLNEAVEKGFLPMGCILQERRPKLKARRKLILIEMAVLPR